MATIKDLRRWYDAYAHCKTGYCCYQEDGKKLRQLVELGHNSGIYGWNWTAYADNTTNTLYISCYRNVPRDICNK